jgi:hypothetical protein
MLRSGFPNHFQARMSAGEIPAKRIEQANPILA